MKIPGYKTVTEASKILHLDADTIRRYASSGRLKAEKVGWSLLFSDKEISRFTSERRPAGRPRKDEA